MLQDKSPYKSIVRLTQDEYQELLGLRKSIEHIKKWCLLEMDTFSAEFVAECVVKMCDDALQIRAAELQRAPVQSEQGGESSEAKCTTERLCPVHNVWHAPRPTRSDGG